MNLLIIPKKVLCVFTVLVTFLTKESKRNSDVLIKKKRKKNKKSFSENNFFVGSTIFSEMTKRIL